MAACALAASDTPVAANPLAELSFDELMETKVSSVYAASKHEQKTSQAPAAVTIITAEDIKQYGYRTLADVLRGVGGFYATYDRTYSFIGVRGVNRPGDFGGRVLTMVDGHRLNESIYDQAFSGGEFPLDLDLVDRVEIVRGPGSALYGNNAFFGVVNVITRRGGDMSGVEASGTVASYDTYTGRLSYGRRWTNGLELLVSGTLLDSAGHDSLHYPEFNAINGGYSENMDGEYAKKFFASISYKDFSLQGVYGDRKKEVPTAPYPGAIFDRGPTYAMDERGYLELKYQHEFEREWLVLGRLFLDRYQYDGAGWFDSADPPDPDQAVLNKDLARTHFWGGELQVSKPFFEVHRLTFGAEFRDDFEVLQKNYDEDPPFTYSDVSSDVDSFGVYLQDEYAVTTNLTLQAGLRYDYFPTFDGTVNPRLGLICNPWRLTTFKLLYGQAYRAPNAYEYDYVAEGYQANHELDPEQIRAYELVWEQGLGQRLHLATSLFYNQIRDLITQEIAANGDLTFRNTATIDARGVETALEGRWARGLRGRLSYTFADAVDTDTDQRLNNSPRHLAKANLVLPLYLDRVYAGLEIQGMSSRRTVRGGETGSYAVANLTLFSRELLRNLELSASLYNLFDKEFADPVSIDYQQEAIVQDGRTFRVKFTYRF